MADGFNFTTENDVEQIYEFSEELGQLSDIDKLRGFYTEIKDSKDPRHRRTKMQCLLKIKAIERNRKKEKFIW